MKNVVDRMHAKLVEAGVCCKDEVDREAIEDALEYALETTQAILVFKCSDCGNTVTAEGYDRVHFETNSQLAAETQRLFCNECSD